jgi:hypothetical protein
MAKNKKINLGFTLIGVILVSLIEFLLMWIIYTKFEENLIIYLSVVGFILINFILFNYIFKKEKWAGLFATILPIFILIIPVIPYGDVGIYVQRSYAYYPENYTDIPSFDTLWLYSSNGNQILDFVKKDLVSPKDKFLLAMFINPKNNSPSITNSFYIKNEGKRTLKNFELEFVLPPEIYELEARDALISSIGLSEGNFYQKKRIIVNIDKLGPGEITYFILRSENLFIPEMECGSSRSCYLNVDTHQAVFLWSNSLGFLIGGKEIRIPDYSNNPGIYYYNSSTNSWINSESLFSNSLEIYIDINSINY